MFGMRILQPSVDHVASVKLSRFDPGPSSPAHRVPQCLAVPQMVPGADAAYDREHRDAEQGKAWPEDSHRAEPERSHEHDEGQRVTVIGQPERGSQDEIAQRAPREEAGFAR